MSTSEAKATAKVRPSRDASPRDPVEYVWAFRRSRTWLADVGVARLRGFEGEGRAVGFGRSAAGEPMVLRYRADARIEVQEPLRNRCETIADLPECLGWGERGVSFATVLRWRPQSGEVALEVFDDTRRGEVVLIEPGRGVVARFELPESHTVLDYSYETGLIALNDRRDSRPVLTEMDGTVRARSRLRCEHLPRHAFSPSGALMIFELGTWACVWRWADDQMVWSEDTVHGAVGWGPSEVLAYVRDGYAAMTWDPQSDERSTLLELRSMRSDRAKALSLWPPTASVDGQQMLFSMMPFRPLEMPDRPPQVVGFPMLAAIDLAHDELALVTDDLGNLLGYSY